MASLMKRTVILSFSRIANKAIVLLSPMLLVRILSISEYGKYREFLLYAGLVAPLVVFGIVHSLLYFIPKYPDRERVWITQTALYTLAASTIATAGIFLAGDIIRANTSFDFVIALQLYIIFFVNLDFLESYWLGKKRTDYVLYYSAVRLILRMVVVVTTAILTKEARLIIVSLIILEAARCLIILSYSVYRRWFSFKISRESLAMQMSYFLPLGAGGVIEVFNLRAGMLFISSKIGPEALAFYVTGAFATQFVNILRGSIADVIFPEIVDLKHSNAKDALPLWKRATVLYCVMLFPLVILFSYYADAIVTVLFTREYSEAIPVFSAFAFLMLLHCFDFHLPLRVQNANRFYVIGSVAALSINVLLLYPMFLIFGLIGPVVAFILSRLLFTLYLGYQTAKLYKIQISEVARWHSIYLVTVSALVCAPVLAIGKYVVGDYIVRAVVFGFSYAVAYLAMLRWLGVWDVCVILRTMAASLRNRRSGASKS